MGLVNGQNESDLSNYETGAKKFMQFASWCQLLISLAIVGMFDCCSDVFCCSKKAR